MSSDPVSNIYIVSSGIIIMIIIIISLQSKRKAVSVNAKEKYGDISPCILNLDNRLTIWRLTATLVVVPQR
jgi:hypothetical protein